jgi:hypothetical protein
MKRGRRDGSAYIIQVPTGPRGGTSYIPSLHLSTRGHVAHQLSYMMGSISGQWYPLNPQLTRKVRNMRRHVPDLFYGRNGSRNTTVSVGLQRTPLSAVVFVV